MAKYLVADGAVSTLASGIASGATSVTVQAGAGALFPQPNTSTGTKFFATFVSASNPNTKEVVTCTARSTDTMTITPTSQSWSAGDTFAILNLAEMLEQLVQFDDLQAQSGNYAIDVGSANAYSVTLTPALSAHLPGTPVRFLAAHANTGASTFNDGVGAASLVLPGGATLPSGIIQANTVYSAVWNSSSNSFELEGAIISAISQLTGQVTDAQVPESAVIQYVAAILASADLTGTPTAPTANAGTNNTQIATTAFAQTAATDAAQAAANPGASLTSPGYQALLSGLIIQWGTVSLGAVDAGGTATGSANFSETFPHAVLAVVDSPVGTGSGSYVYNRTALTTSSISYGAHGVVTGYNEPNASIEYLAIGW